MTLPIDPLPSRRDLDRLVLRLLRSPFGRLVGGSTVAIRYVGRRSGLRRELPVEYFALDGDYAIHVATPERKQWWRNFETVHPIELARREWRVRGSGLVVRGDSEAGTRVARTYLSGHRGAAARLGLRWVVGEEPTDAAIRAAAADVVFVLVTPEPSAG